MAEGTKARILLAALELFSLHGVSGTSMSDIAGQLGITKAALYKHYESKQQIFEQILERMRREDEARAALFEMPTHAQDRRVTLTQLNEYALAQFNYWTQDPFASAFRRLLLLEQYSSEAMQQLYRQTLSAGQLEYIETIFAQLKLPEPRASALRYFAPLYLCYSLSDGEDAGALQARLKAHFEQFLIEEGVEKYELSKE